MRSAIRNFETAFMSRPSILVASLLLGLLSACSGLPDRLPRLVSDPPSASTVKPKAIPIPASGLVDVAPGDTVYAIARRYGVAMRDVIDANKLKAPFLLQVGQSLHLPPPRIYIVAPGDTIYSVSGRFGVDMRTLVAMNGLAAPYQVSAGQQLKMPVRGEPEQAPRGTSTSGVADARDTSSVPLPRPRPTNVSKGVTTGGSAEKASRPAVATRSSGRSFPLRPPSRGGKRFLWPVRGRIISNFGPREGGLHNDGINIAAPKGVPILAADNGIVAYAGKELRGFGNLLLIKHAGGWTTAYAHAQRLLVKRGDRVKRGQTIGTIGNSGGVGRSQLHFELRRGARAVDPRVELEI
jgi:murein DD-endopeptidase MepM/ murein hydrolase activator NlpD